MNEAITKSMSPSTMKEGFERQSLYAVIVTYHPDESVYNNIERVLEFYSYIVIVDNTEVGESDDLLTHFSNVERVEIIANCDNKGIAEALNQGVARSEELGATWVTTFDQDSYLLEDYPSLIQSYINDISSKGRLPVFGCSHIDPSQVEVAKKWQESINAGFQAVDEVITSGMTFSVMTWRLLNGFDSQLFIDFVDHDFCAMARNNNISCLITKKPVLVHALGDQTTHRFFHKRVRTSNHSPFRRYYMARNTVVYAKRYRAKCPDIVFAYCRHLLFEQIKILLFEREKGKKILSFIRGVFDGLMGGVGRI